MIITEPLGGLGNQLFQYAAAYTLAQKHGTTVKIDNSRFKTYKAWPYMLPLVQVPQDMATEAEINALMPGASHIKSQRLRKWLGIRDAHFYCEPHFHYDEAFEQLDDNTFLRGYFQSERYFASHGEALRALFQPAAPASDNALRYQADIRAATIPVSLHVRRGDYISNKAALTTHGNIGLAYYQQAVRIITALAGAEPHFFLFSDDPDWAEANLTFCRQRTVVRGNDAAPERDMWLMSQCRHHITANSTFSWWGAWLNPAPDKQVIAPRNWFAYDELIGKNTRDIYPQGWLLI